MAYLWLKALHVAAAETWIGGLLIAALAVAAVSTSVAPRSASERRWLDVVRRWDRRVTSSAMLVVWGLGITMAIQGGWFASPWLIAKLVVVVALSALHGMLSGTLRRATSEAGRTSPATQFHAGPSVVAAVIVIAVLAVTKPF